METLYYSHFNSPIGLLTIGISERGLVLLNFGAERLSPHKQSVAWVKSEEKTRPYTQELQEYFAGKRKHFTFSLDLRGTKFQKACWRALLRIPYGKTRSYGDIARGVGSPLAYRAVGMANHQNPVAIVVPCHRVIASDGTLGGYGGGLDIKKMLLRLEGARGRVEITPKRARRAAI